ncbi:hypothetical protein FACS189434_01300 [Bacteroidia bacterium]|nr:hypothetical protein FACS189434_01300 [Bacteroidia bacterium]
MEAILKTPTQRMNFYFKQLKEIKPEYLERNLRLMYAKILAQKLQGQVLPNNITMQEIVDEVREVRNQRYERNRI